MVFKFCRPAARLCRGCEFFCRCRQRVRHLSVAERAAAFRDSLPTSVQFRGADSLFASDVIADLDDHGVFIRPEPSGAEALLLLKVESPVPGYVLIRRTPGGRLARSNGRPIHYEVPVVGASCPQLKELFDKGCQLPGQPVVHAVHVCRATGHCPWSAARTPVVAHVKVLARAPAGLEHLQLGRDVVHEPPCLLVWVLYGIYWWVTHIVALWLKHSWKAAAGVFGCARRAVNMVMREVGVKEETEDLSGQPDPSRAVPVPDPETVSNQDDDDVKSQTESEPSGYDRCFGGNIIMTLPGRNLRLYTGTCRGELLKDDDGRPARKAFLLSCDTGTDLLERFRDPEDNLVWAPLCDLCTKTYLSLQHERKCSHTKCPRPATSGQSSIKLCAEHEGALLSGQLDPGGPKRRSGRPKATVADQPKRGRPARAGDDREDTLEEPQLVRPLATTQVRQLTPPPSVRSRSTPPPTPDSAERRFQLAEELQQLGEVEPFTVSLAPRMRSFRARVFTPTRVKGGDITDPSKRGVYVYFAAMEIENDTVSTWPQAPPHPEVSAKGDWWKMPKDHWVTVYLPTLEWTAHVPREVILDRKEDDPGWREGDAKRKEIWAKAAKHLPPILLEVVSHKEVETLQERVAVKSGMEIGEELINTLKDLHTKVPTVHVFGAVFNPARMAKAGGATPGEVTTPGLAEVKTPTEKPAVEKRGRSTQRSESREPRPRVSSASRDRNEKLAAVESARQAAVKEERRVRVSIVTEFLTQVDAARDPDLAVKQVARIRSSKGGIQTEDDVKAELCVALSSIWSEDGLPKGWTEQHVEWLSEIVDRWQHERKASEGEGIPTFTLPPPEAERPFKPGTVEEVASSTDPAASPDLSRVVQGSPAPQAPAKKEIIGAGVTPEVVDGTVITPVVATSKKSQDLERLRNWLASGSMGISKVSHPTTKTSPGKDPFFGNMIVYPWDTERVGALPSEEADGGHRPVMQELDTETRREYEATKGSDTANALQALPAMLGAMMAPNTPGTKGKKGMLTAVTQEDGYRVTHRRGFHANSSVLFPKLCGPSAPKLAKDYAKHHREALLKSGLPIPVSNRLLYGANKCLWGRPGFEAEQDEDDEMTQYHLTPSDFPLFREDALRSYKVPIGDAVPQRPSVLADILHWQRAASKQILTYGLLYGLEHMPERAGALEALLTWHSENPKTFPEWRMRKVWDDMWYQYEQELESQHESIMAACRSKHPTLAEYKFQALLPDVDGKPRAFFPSHVFDVTSPDGYFRSTVVPQIREQNQGKLLTLADGGSQRLALPSTQFPVPTRGGGVSSAAASLITEEEEQEAWQASPDVDDGVKIAVLCLDYTTHAGCKRPGCQYAHTFAKINRLHPAIAKYIISRRGHKRLPELSDEEMVRQLERAREEEEISKAQKIAGQGGVLGRQPKEARGGAQPPAYNMAHVAGFPCLSTPGGWL